MDLPELAEPKCLEKLVRKHTVLIVSLSGENKAQCGVQALEVLMQETGAREKAPDDAGTDPDMGAIGPTYLCTYTHTICICMHTYFRVQCWRLNREPCTC